MKPIEGEYIWVGENGSCYFTYGKSYFWRYDFEGYFHTFSDTTNEHGWNLRNFLTWKSWFPSHNLAKVLWGV